MLDVIDAACRVVDAMQRFLDLVHSPSPAEVGLTSMRTYVRAMTSPYTAFDLAIKTKGVYLAETAMAELPVIGHEHRAALVLLYNEKEPDKYERAAKRWIGRLLEDPRCKLTLSELARVAMALEALPAVGANSRFELAAIFKAAGLRDLARVFAPGATPGP